MTYSKDQLLNTAPGTKGVKLDTGKTQADLLLSFSRALEEVAKVSTFGAEKYTRDGWVSVENGIERYRAAAMRHLFKTEREALDPESGLSHTDHMIWNWLAVRELELRSQEPETELTSELLETPNATLPAPRGPMRLQFSWRKLQDGELILVELADDFIFAGDPKVHRVVCQAPLIPFAYIVEEVLP